MGEKERLRGELRMCGKSELAWKYSVINFFVIQKERKRRQKQK